MRKITIAITAASFSGNQGSAAMLHSSVRQLRERYGERLRIVLMSTYPEEDRRLISEMPDDYSFIEVVSAKPEKLLFLAFPLAVLYAGLRFIPPLGALLRLNRIIRAYAECDIVIDEAGISFVDSRGFIMNTYAFVCAAVPLLCGKPVVKYSQAMGSFKNGWNRFLAKWILPKISLICARGELTRESLESIGIKDNVKLCADGAFSMSDSGVWRESIDALCEEDNFYRRRVVALSVSSVVEEKCRKLRRDYKGCMIQFINWLNELDYNVLIVANAAKAGTTKPRNNDLIVCSEIYDAVRDKSKVRWYPREMAAGEIRELLGRTECVVASRFHAMIAALDRKIPVLMIGWSHKYKEVLDMFDLGDYCVDYSQLEIDSLKGKFMGFIRENDNIRVKIEEHLPAVRESSLDNIRRISRIIDHIDLREQALLEPKAEPLPEERKPSAIDDIADIFENDETK